MERASSALDRKLRKLRGILILFLGAVLLTVPIRLFVARPFIVSGASMEPTFAPAEYLVVDELTYRFRTPQRGDIIIMRYPLDVSKFFIKRIVGLPGEVISVKDGSVSVLGKSGEVNVALNEPYRARSYKKDLEVTTLGPDEYFVLGDNRDESSDSRTWGPLPRKYILGRALFRLYPFHEAGYLPGKFWF